MNRNMTQLEEIYLSNVVLYLDKVKTAELFTMVNKKCKDALHILHINPSYPVSNKSHNFITKECNFSLQKSFLKEMALFPHLETVYFTEQTMQFLPLIPQKVVRIQLPFVSPESSFLKDEKIRQMIVSLSFKNPKEAIDLSDFEKLTSVCLIINNHLKVDDFLRNRHQRFEKVYVKMEGFADMDFINHVERYNIGKVVVEFDEKRVLEGVIQNRELFRHMTVCYKECYKNMDKDVVIHHRQHSGEFEITKKGVDGDLLMAYYPQHIKITGFTKKQIELDLSPFDFIQSIKSTNSSIRFKTPTSLTHLDSKFNYDVVSLKELHLQGKNEQRIHFPDSLTALTISDFKEISNYSHLKRLSLCSDNHFPVLMCQELTYLSLSCNTCDSLRPLTNLQILCLNKQLRQVDLENFYPTSLRSLQCYSDSLPKQLPTTKLVLNDFIRTTNVQLYSKLQCLRVAGNISDFIKLPSALTSLTISCFGSSKRLLSFKHLGSYGVKELHLENCIVRSVELPPQLKSLYLHYSEFEITGVVEIENLILNESVVNLDNINKEKVKRFYSRKSKISELVSYQLYHYFPQVQQSLLEIV